VNGLLTAVSFLTRLPVRSRKAVDAVDVAQSAAFFPLIGAVIGSIFCLAALLLKGHLPPLAIGAILALLDALLTGALHLDGLADAADGLGGGRTPEDALRIMHDHRIGSFGGAALALCVVTKVAAYSGLMEQSGWAAALILAPALGRWSTLILTATYPYAGLSGSIADGMGKRALVLGTILIVLGLAFVGSVRALIATFLVVLLTLCFGRYCRSRICGINGDTLGANVELCECATLLAFLWKS
jgi:cobalamin 5'-phosphate synthase/cobalamin synthase